MQSQKLGILRIFLKKLKDPEDNFTKGEKTEDFFLQVNKNSCNEKSIAPDDNRIGRITEIKERHSL